MREKVQFFLVLLWIFTPVFSIHAFETHRTHSVLNQNTLSLNVIKNQLGQGIHNDLSTHPWLTVRSVDTAVGRGSIGSGDKTEIILGSIAEDFDLISNIVSQSVASHEHYTEFPDEDTVLLPYGYYLPALSPQDAIHSDRAQNHFYSGGYAPLATNGQAGRLNDPKLLNNSTVNLFFNLSPDRESAVYWALNSSINGAGLMSINGQTPTSRKFRILGHLLHILQDMSVPEHVRDDAHAKFVGGPSPYEDRLGDLTFEQHETWASGRPSMAPVTRSDLNVYYEELAEYTRTHFFSSDTIFSTTTGMSLEPHYTNWNFNDMIGSDRYVTGQNGGTTVRLARYTMLGRLRLRSYSETLGGFSITSTQVVPYPKNYTEATANTDFFTVNDEGIVQDYWLVMKPRILAYCAGFIDKFIAAFVTPALPTVQTLAASSVTTIGATLNGSVNTNGIATNYWFEYGTSPALATYLSTATKSAGSGTTSLSFSETISGLQAGTTYYFRIAASSSGGTARGSVQSFVAYISVPKFAYVVNVLSDTITGYSVNTTTGVLTNLGTVPTGDEPSSIVVDPSGRFAYVTNSASDTVSSYSINTTTGALTSVGTVPSGDKPLFVAVDPSGRFAYVVNVLSGTVSSYSINSTTGGLTIVGTVPAGVGPISVAVDQSGRFAYVVNADSDNITPYLINTTTGVLTSGGTVPAGDIPHSIAVDPSGRFAYVTNYNSNDVWSYSINSTTGGLTIVGTAPAGDSPSRIAVDPSGRFAYVANLNSDNITEYSINTTTGGLTVLGTVPAGDGPYSVAVDPSGRFVYAANWLSDNVSVYSINTTTGVLTNVSTVPAGDGASSVAITGSIE